MQQVFKVAAGGGYIKCVDRENAGLQHVALDVLRLKAGESWSGESDEEEIGLVTLSGSCAVYIAGQHAVEWPNLGGRPNPFAGAPGAAYIPRDTSYRVAGETDVELAVFKAKCDVRREPFALKPGDLAAGSVGAANWRRDVRLIFPPGSARTGRLIIGETINPPGNWSGFPPHKHDKVAADEYPLEEVYFFKTQPVEGYGVQLIYGGEEGDRAHIIGNDDVAVFRSGYHPLVAAPGVQVYFIWALAGNERIYKVSIDPRYRWLSHAEAILREVD